VKYNFYIHLDNKKYCSGRYQTTGSNSGPGRCLQGIRSYFVTYCVNYKNYNGLTNNQSDIYTHYTQNGYYGSNTHLTHMNSGISEI
jgi:hypothetical protein